MNINTSTPKQLAGFELSFAAIVRFVQLPLRTPTEVADDFDKASRLVLYKFQSHRIFDDEADVSGLWKEIHFLSIIQNLSRQLVAVERDIERPLSGA